MTPISRKLLCKDYHCSRLNDAIPQNVIMRREARKNWDKMRDVVNNAKAKVVLNESILQILVNQDDPNYMNRRRDLIQLAIHSMLKH